MPEPVDAADVVVVGGGLAGHAAALAAAEAGAHVVLLEKRARHGGSSALAGGGLLFAGTPLQRRAGVADSADALRADLAAAGRGASDPALLDAYVEAQAAVYDWLCGHGAGFSLTGQPVRRLHVMAPGALVDLLHARALEHPRIRYRPGAPVVALLTNRRAVTGVIAGAGELRSPVTSRCVVLCSGGFSRNRAMVAELAPQCAPAVAMGGAGSDGDGLRMAMELGAQPAGMEFVEASFGASATAGVEPRLLYAHFDGAVIVNSLGRRFADEGSDIKALGKAVAGQPGGLAFQIFDQAVMDASRPAPKPRDFAAALRDGLLVQAPTLAGLADRIGMPAATLQESARTLGRPPYYSFACTAGLTSTYGGLRVDRAMRVLDGAGSAIRGLFAAGEIVGGFHGAGYLVGSALGKAAVFGHLAGREAARTITRSMPSAAGT
ncbi:FAD-dependent oxidoreductase [Dactylosporangium sp. CA-092794]|uniref:FAD-dependent oxidoreductase n=1 Tax=Dactylosporangium sp. CA-092794 TaxID=3239929 RepID=UPI003D92B2EF